MLRTVAMAALAALVASVGAGGPSAAARPAGWEALAPAEGWYGPIATPASGALFVGGPAKTVTTDDGKEQRLPGDLLRSDDGGLTWAAIAPPSPDMDILTVSPVDHRVLYAGGKGQLLRSEDDGATWALISDRPEVWTQIAVSPADPSTVYGVSVASPPRAGYGSNSWRTFLVSRDGGATWEAVRSEKEEIFPGSQPACGYVMGSLQPHGLDPRRIVTIEGCSFRGADPRSRQSLDEGRTARTFPDLPHGSYESWAAHGIVGGRGVNPSRWYASVFKAGFTYSRVYQGTLLRSDDDGATWTPLLESDSGGTDRAKARAVDMVSKLAYDPVRPDDLYALFRHREPTFSGTSTSADFRVTDSVRASRDGGATWSELGMPHGAYVSDLAVGIDGRYLFATTDTGIYRLALAR